ncbi:transcriptional regulator, ArsR family [Shewanella sediminis HAW-EB3]|uniref:Transcriptional regulator, ArsR family n=2 Tax=Shewanella sediminis TaxID=271097 RepID=A8FY09_SHESH|nr:transcriptional regulator, ArsR family [Shewanella sediminis HAW-EB3]
MTKEINKMSQFKKSLNEQFSVIAKAMSNPNRLEMLEFLAQCEYSVDDLAKVMGLSVANTSHHLQQLRLAGLVASRKEAQRVFYRLKGDGVVELMASMKRVAESHVTEVKELVNTYLYSKDEMEPIPREELLKRASEGSVTVIDVRPSVEYASGHLPGAINLTVEELKKQFSVIEPNQEVIAYCRGAHCILAFEAVEFLRSKGFQTRRLEDGFPEWKSAGFPIN